MTPSDTRSAVRPFTTRLPEQLDHRLADYCAATAATKAGVLRLALDDYLASRELTGSGAQQPVKR